MWEEFARGYFAMYVTGPWNIGEFRRRLPAEMQDKWATAILPRPAASEFSVSQAGGCGLVLFRSSQQQEAAWRLIEFLSEPAQQVRFYELTGNLPPRKSSWQLGRLAEDPHMRAFHEQLEHVVPLPRVPEWEQITTKIIQAGQAVIAGQVTIDRALANLDRAVDNAARETALDVGQAGCRAEINRLVCCLVISPIAMRTLAKLLKPGILFLAPAMFGAWAIFFLADLGVSCTELHRFRHLRPGRHGQYAIRWLGKLSPLAG